MKVIVKDGATASLTRLRQRLQNPRPLFVAIREETRFEINDQLKSNVNAQRWKPLSPRYRRWKLRKVGLQPILVFSGKLRQRYLKAGIINGNRFTFGLDDPIALAHHLGRLPVPERRLDYRFVPAMTSKHLRLFVSDAIKKAFRK